MLFLLLSLVLLSFSFSVIIKFINKCLLKFHPTKIQVVLNIKDFTFKINWIQGWDPINWLTPLSQARTMISNIICCGFFSPFFSQCFEARCDYSFRLYWWNSWPFLKLSFHHHLQNKIKIQILASQICPRLKTVLTKTWKNVLLDCTIVLIYIIIYRKHIQDKI